VRTSDIVELRDLLKLARPQLLERIGRTDDDVEDGCAYQSLEGLSAVRRTERPAVDIYLDGDRVVMIAVSSPDITPAALRRLVAPGATELPSRQGKSAVITVDAKAGLAFSAEDDEVGFVEIFPSTTDDDYRSRVYWDPGAFTK
jgi:hypothetical protein